MSQTHFVYVLRCADDSYYTGYTTDLDRRVAEHNAGTGAKYTRGRGPVELVYHERHPSKSAAMQREYAIKQLRRAQKHRLVETGSTAGSTSGESTEECDTTDATDTVDTAEPTDEPTDTTRSTAGCDPSVSDGRVDRDDTP